jgi:hypothetical protein
MSRENRGAPFCVEQWDADACLWRAIGPWFATEAQAQAFASGLCRVGMDARLARRRPEQLELGAAGPSRQGVNG